MSPIDFKAYIKTIEKSNDHSLLPSQRNLAYNDYFLLLYFSYLAWLSDNGGTKMRGQGITTAFLLLQLRVINQYIDTYNKEQVVPEIEDTTNEALLAIQIALQKKEETQIRSTYQRIKYRENDNAWLGKKLFGIALGLVTVATLGLTGVIAPPVFVSIVMIFAAIGSTYFGLTRLVGAYPANQMPNYTDKMIDNEMVMNLVGAELDYELNDKKATIKDMVPDLSRTICGLTSNEAEPDVPGLNHAIKDTLKNVQSTTTGSVLTYQYQATPITVKPYEYQAYQYQATAITPQTVDKIKESIRARIYG